jgi:hypothetical protein
MYSKGHGVSQTDVKAIRWLQKAANQGDAQAQNNLSRLLFIRRKGVPKDLAVPQKFPTLSAAQGEESAMVNLTKEFPIGAPVSLPKASSSESLSTPGCAYCGIFQLISRNVLGAEPWLIAVASAHWRTGRRNTRANAYRHRKQNNSGLLNQSSFLIKHRLRTIQLRHLIL